MVHGLQSCGDRAQEPFRKLSDSTDILSQFVPDLSSSGPRFLFQQAPVSLPAGAAEFRVDGTWFAGTWFAYVLWDTEMRSQGERPRT